jgi:AraC-like DNA-binding protein
MESARANGDANRDMRWSTADLPEDQRIDDWVAMLSTTITEMDVTAEDPATFAANWQRYGLGPIDLNFLQAKPQRVQHTPGKATRKSVADYDLLYMKKGPADLRHCGKDMRVSEGSFVLLDNQNPYDLRFPDGSFCLTTHFEDSWLRKWVPHPAKLVAKPIDATNDWGTPLAALLSTIASRGLGDAALSRSIIADQLGSLLALMAGVGEDFASQHQAGLFVRLKRALQDRFDDAELDPATLAQEMGISKRHLHGVFAASGATFGGVLMEIRLARAAEMLVDSRYSGYRIGDIAWACGFADPSHFARRFRERHGASPLEMRALSEA